MNDALFRSKDEIVEFISQYKRLISSLTGSFSPIELKLCKSILNRAIQQGCYTKDEYDFNPLSRLLATANVLIEEVGLRKTSIISLFLYEAVVSGSVSAAEVEKHFGADVMKIIRGLSKINELYAKNPSIESENFSKLFITFSEDVRVVLIMLASRLFLLRALNNHPNNEFRRQVAYEASYLYAPLAHRLGLYRIKSEMEDLSLKYTNREIYTEIARNLSETKRDRDLYIHNFIEPVRQKLTEVGLKFEIKGRTKSIHSIWNKIRKQEVTFEKIYDLFAIRIIIDATQEREKAECWHAYSIVTDMYQPNPKRLRDWLSIPKSNGYESLHITVMGPEGKWVEVQIRTQRMDDIAERGLAAHWKYKGVKGGEKGLDEWLNNVREVLEAHDASPLDVMQELKPALYEKEIFVFTPKGDLYKLPKGATVLDFAFNIHTGLGSKCVGAKINDKNVTIKQKLSSGDQVEIITSPLQKPKQDWLNIVTTSKARIKIKQALKEATFKEAEYGKEVLQRRLKNRKMEPDEATMMRLMKKNGYKNSTDFFADLGTDKLDVNKIVDQLIELDRKEKGKEANTENRTAENYTVSPTQEAVQKKEDELVIDQNLRGVEYKLAKCCNPIYGDEIFGFVSTIGGIKIHRTSCTNAPQMISRFGYRIVKAKWAGKSDSQYSITLHVIGKDDIGIVTNITSFISKEKNVVLRSISINSHDGLFSGNITISINDTAALEALIKKIKTVKGVKSVERGSHI